MINDVEHVLISCLSLGKCLCKSVAHFSVWLSFFIAVKVLYSGYESFADTGCAHIFSHSGRWRFTSLMVCFL